MAQTRPEFLDLGVTCVIVASQLAIVRILFRDWKDRISRVAFFAILAFLAVGIWPFILNAVWRLIQRLSRIGSASTSSPQDVGGAISLAWGFASSVAVLIYLVVRWFHRRNAARIEGFSPERRQILQTAGAVVVAAPFGLVAFGGIIERTAFHVKEVDIRITNLHPDLEGMQIVQLSDLHVSPYLSIKELARAIDMANELKPYIHVITGDLITQPGDPIDATIRQLGRLRADYGVYGCMGNHEVFAQVVEHTEHEAARYGMDFLRQTRRPIKRGAGELSLAGIDFQPFNKKDEYMNDADGLLVPGMPNILLSHNPDVFPVAAGKGYDLTLAGHTHGGQVTVEILNQTANIARFFTPYVSGLYKSADKSCYVTAGIGTIGMPVRIGAPPEITLVRLRRA